MFKIILNFIIFLASYASFCNAKVNDFFPEYNNEYKDFYNQADILITDLNNILEKNNMELVQLSEYLKKNNIFFSNYDVCNNNFTNIKSIKNLKNFDYNELYAQTQIMIGRILMYCNLHNIDYFEKIGELLLTSFKEILPRFSNDFLKEEYARTNLLLGMINYSRMDIAKCKHYYSEASSTEYGKSDPPTRRNEILCYRSEKNVGETEFLIKKFLKDCDDKVLLCTTESKNLIYDDLVIIYTSVNTLKYFQNICKNDIFSEFKKTAELDIECINKKFTKKWDEIKALYNNDESVNKDKDDFNSYLKESIASYNLAFYINNPEYRTANYDLVKTSSDYLYNLLLEKKTKSRRLGVIQTLQPFFVSEKDYEKMNLMKNLFQDEIKKVGTKLLREKYTWGFYLLSMSSDTPKSYLLEIQKEIEKFEELTKISYTNFLLNFSKAYFKILDSEGKKGLSEFINNFKENPYFNYDKNQVGNEALIKYLLGQIWFDSKFNELNKDTNWIKDFITLLVIDENMQNNTSISTAINLIDYTSKYGVNISQKLHKIKELENNIENNLKITNVRNDLIENYKNQHFKLLQELKDYKELGFLTKRNINLVGKLNQNFGEDEALIKYFEYYDKSYILLLSKNSFKVEKLDRNDLKKLTQNIYLLNSYLKQPEDFDFDVSFQVYQTIFGKFENELKKIKSLNIINTGIFSKVNFHSLISQKINITSVQKNNFFQRSFESLSNLVVRGIELKQKDRNDLSKNRIDFYKNASWLIKKFSFNILPSINSFFVLKSFDYNENFERKFIGFGSPVLKGKMNCKKNLNFSTIFRGNEIDMTKISELCPLPETANEIKEINKILFSKNNLIFLGKDSLEKNFHESTLSSEVITFATHSLLGNDIPELNQSAIILTPKNTNNKLNDGLLTSTEIASKKINSNLVILSACNTGVNENIGTINSLAHAFFISGVRSLLVSNWSIETESTVYLTTKAIKLYKQKDMNFSEALRLSMMELLNKTQYNHPFYWASFNYIGINKYN